MQIMIDIPEDVYTRLFDKGIQDNEIAVDDVCEMARSIRLGTPLPKGHGRLIDASKVLTEIYNSDVYDDGYYYGQVYHAIHDAPTIIEADKESDDHYRGAQEEY